jgi:hemerythrin superfamily protein
MSLTRTLHAQHREVERIAEMLSSSLGEGHPSMNRVQELLADLGRSLTAHLSVEDAELYPALVARAREHNRPELERIALQFSENMGRITQGLLAFLGKYSRPTDAHLPSLRHEWRDVRHLLADRIRSEEATLYPLFEKLSKVSGSV